LLKDLLEMTAKFSKGDLVKLDEAVCFTKANGGKLKYPLTNYANDEARVVHGFYKMTDRQQAEWYERHRADVRAGRDTWHNDAGESRLCPLSGRVTIKAGMAYRVLRARCRASSGYGNPTPGLAQILDLETGYEVYVKRTLLEKVTV